MKKYFPILAVLMAFLYSSCSGDKGGEVTTKKEELPIVKLAAVSERPVEQLYDFSATVEAKATNHIAPASPVRIHQISVEVGDRVKRGQQLVTMDAANLQQMELQLANSRVEFERSDELYKIGGVSRSEWDALKTAYEVQRTAYEDLRRNTVLTSPIDGVVTARNYDNGDLYAGGQPVLVVEQITPVKLIVNVSENNYTQVRNGDKVAVRLDVYGDEVFEGKISLIYPTVDPATRTFPVEITLANNDLRVRPGMFARATLNFGERQHVVVPDQAVVKQPGAGDYYVYVYKDGKVSYNKVVLGRRMGSEYELISGVPTHSQVVVAGQSRLADGVAV